MSVEQPIRVTLEQEDGYAFRIRFDAAALAPLLGDKSFEAGA